MKVNSIEHRTDGVPIVDVSLSRSNLLALLAMLEAPMRFGDNTRTIHRYDGDAVLVVHVEPDDVHYHDRKRGFMGELVERLMEKIEKRSETNGSQQANDHRHPGACGQCNSLPPGI